LSNIYTTKIGAGIIFFILGMWELIGKVGGEEGVGTGHLSVTTTAGARRNGAEETWVGGVHRRKRGKFKPANTKYLLHQR